MKIQKKHLIFIFALIIGRSHSSFGLGATLGQLTSTATGASVSNTNTDSGTKPADTKSDGIPMNSPLAAISVTPIGIDPSSMDAEVKMPITTDASISPKADPNTPSITPDSGASGANTATNTPSTPIDFDLLWTCRQSPASIKDKEKCATAMQFFCAGRCTRLNCAILTNRATCLDVCGSNNPMMEPCIMAGKRNTSVNIPLQSFPVTGAGYNPMIGMGMNPGMAGAAMIGSMAGSGISAIASGVGKLFGADKTNKKSKETSNQDLFSGQSSLEKRSDKEAAQAEINEKISTTRPATTIDPTKKPPETSKKPEKKKA